MGFINNNIVPCSPEDALKEGHWFKLICGASYQDLPTIRSLVLAYSLAGADCIDLAADEAVINAAWEGIEVAQAWEQMAIAKGLKTRPGNPWLMVSLNDAEDPHFRKATFDPNHCPADCPRPCESICPAQAIQKEVIPPRCYGCGRCLPVCPSQIIETRSHRVSPDYVMALGKVKTIDAIEIHTQVGHEEDFKKLWQVLAPNAPNLKLLAISCQDHPDLLDYLHSLYETLQPIQCPLVWQTDGRPMSGDIGKGTTHSSIRMAQKICQSPIPGYIQLAGGTNAHTVNKLKSLGLRSSISGIAYGSYARSLLQPILESLEIRNQPLENCPDLFWSAVEEAYKLVAPLKTEKIFGQISY